MQPVSVEAVVDGSWLVFVVLTSRSLLLCVRRKMCILICQGFFFLWEWDRPTIPTDSGRPACRSYDLIVTLLAFVIGRMLLYCRDQLRGRLRQRPHARRGGLPLASRRRVPRLLAKRPEERTRSLPLDRARADVRGDVPG